MRQLLTLFLILTGCFCQEAMAQLSADFSVDHAGGCSPLVVHFSPIVFGVASGGGGATAKATHMLTVYPPPDVNFTAGRR